MIRGCGTWSCSLWKGYLIKDLVKWDTKEKWESQKLKWRDANLTGSPVRRVGFDDYESFQLDTFYDSSLWQKDNKTTLSVRASAGALGKMHQNGSLHLVRLES